MAQSSGEAQGQGKGLGRSRSCQWQGLTSWGLLRPCHLCAHCRLSPFPRGVICNQL